MLQEIRIFTLNFAQKLIANNFSTFRTLIEWKISKMILDLPTYAKKIWQAR